MEILSCVGGMRSLKGIRDEIPMPASMAQGRFTGFQTRPCPRRSRWIWERSTKVWMRSPLFPITGVNPGQSPGPLARALSGVTVASSRAAKIRTPRLPVSTRRTEPVQSPSRFDVAYSVHTIQSGLRKAAARRRAAARGF